MAKHIFVIIGLVLDLSGAYLLATNGIGIRRIRRLAMQRRIAKRSTIDLTRSPWGKVLTPGILVTLLTSIVLYELRGQKVWPIALWGLSILVQIAWIPALSNYSIPYVDDIGVPAGDNSVEKLHLRGLCLLGAGFIFEALGAVLD